MPWIELFGRAVRARIVLEARTATVSEGLLRDLLSRSRLARERAEPP
jgi:hypothetical protein